MKYQHIFPSILIIAVIFSFVASSAFFMLRNSITDQHSLVTYAVTYVREHPHIVDALADDDITEVLLPNTPPSYLYGATPQPITIATPPTICKSVLMGVGTLYNSYSKSFTATTCQN